MPNYPPNPFTPSFGRIPPLLAGREHLLQLIEDEIRKENISFAYENLLVTAPRGMGKTALLATAQNMAKKAKWVTIRADAGNQQMLQMIARQMLDTIKSRWRYKLKALSLRIFGLEAEVSLDALSVYDNPNCLSLMKKVIPRKKSRRGLMILVDEIHTADIDEIRRLGKDLQIVRTSDGKKVVFIAAGLSEILPRIDSEKSSFFSRISHETLDQLSYEEAQKVLSTGYQMAGYKVSDEIIKLGVDASHGGYPYMLQLIGHRSIQVARAEASLSSISQDHMRKAIHLAELQLTRSVMYKYWSRMTWSGRDFMAALAESSGEATLESLAQKLDKSLDAVTHIHKDLAAINLVEISVDNKTRFTLQGARDFLINQGYARPERETDNGVEYYKIEDAPFLFTETVTPQTTQKAIQPSEEEMA